MSDNFRGYATLLRKIKQRVLIAQQRAIYAANEEMLRMYWDIGGMLQQSQDADGWGKKTLQRLAVDLKNVFSTTVCPDPWKNECKFGAILFRAVERGAGPYASERSPPSDKCGPDLSNRVPAISARTIFLF